MRIAMIGLGAMGFAMAKRLAERQHHVVGCDVRPEAVAALEAVGGHGAFNAVDAVADADAVILMVVNAEQVESVLFADGMLDAIPAGAPIICMATVAPVRARAIAKRVVGAGRTYLDAPVSGGVPGIEAATLSIMVGAPDAAFAKAEPLLREIGSNTRHVGPEVGQGSALKTVNQLLAGVHIAAAAEALALAEREGIAPELALDVLSNSAASSWMLCDRGPRMLEAYRGDVRSAVDIFVKDLGIVQDTGRADRVPLPLAAAALQSFLSASALGLGAADDSQVVESYRRAAGLEPRDGAKRP